MSPKLNCGSLYTSTMHPQRNLGVLRLTIPLFISAVALAAMEVQLRPSDASPSVVGTVVTWRTQATVATASDTLWYRFRVREVGQSDFRMLRDFGPDSELVWAPVEHEGQFEIEVSVRGLESGDTGETIAPYNVTPATASGRPAARMTPNPLVFLYSAPPCRAGLSMRVTFSTAGVPTSMTPAKECDGVRTMNFYLAGMYPETRYNARHQTLSGTQVTATGAPVEFTTGSLPNSLAKYSVTAGSAGNGVIIRSPLNSTIAATDLDGNVIWFYQYQMNFLTRAEAGGTFWGFYQAAGLADQLLRKIDLAGIALLETNAARVSEQLIVRGERPITGFHHEVVPLPEDRVLVLATVAEPGEKWGHIGGDVLGDKLVVLDRDLNVVWTWDGWDHVDPINHPPVLRENCLSAGCPAEYANTKALDWMHSNSVQMTPDGNLLLSVRHLDQLFQIDYSNGNGSGAILWKLGNGGDIQLAEAPGDDWPWFSHQHDAHFVDEKTILLLDNGNTRAASGLIENINSRGQLYEIDESTLTAKLVHNFDLGSFSFALGSAQKLANGNFHFNIGYIPPFRGYSIEMTPGGELLYRIDTSVAEYRAIRLTDMYSGPK